MVGSGAWIKSAIALSLGVGKWSDGRTQHLGTVLILCMFGITKLSCPSEHFASRLKVYSFSATVLSV